MPSTTIYANKGARIALRTSDGWEAGAGASDYLPVAQYSGYRYRALLGFSYSFTGWTGITSATLNLRTSGQFYVAFGSDPDVIVRRLIESFSEGSSSDLSSSNAVTWANQPSATTSNEATFDVSTIENDWVSVDITAIMQDALAAGVFYGLKLYGVDESSASDVTEFYSDDTTSEPYISITYSTNTAPNAPVSLSPTGDALQNTLTPTFSGTFSDPDSGDTMSGVQIQVYLDNGTTLKWDSGMLSDGGTTFARPYTGSALTGNTFYKWRARTKDAAGAVGVWSALQRFKVNSVPTAPSRSISGTASDLTDLTPILYVTHNDADASDQNLKGYRVIVYRDADNSVIWDTGDQTHVGIHTLALTYAGPALSWQTQYYFKARTKDANGAWSPYSSTLSFVTHTTGIPISLSPANGNIAGSINPTFTGNRGKSNDSLTHVEIEVYASNGTTLIWNSGTIADTGTSFSQTYSGPALTPSVDYKWRARVTSNPGGVSAWSALQSFQAPDTNAPTLVSPLGAGITDLTPDLTFSRGVAFIDHELEVYEEDGITLLWSNAPASYASTMSKAVTYAGPALDWGTTYKWRVRVSADGSVFTPWTGLGSFTTDVAGVPTLTAPASGSWETTTTPTFTGDTEGSEDIATFRIIIEDEGGSQVWDSGNLAGDGTSFSKVYDGSTALTKGSQYFWKASYIKDGGAPGDFSVPQSFHINADPTAPSAMIPAAGAVVADTLTPTFYATFEDSDIVNWGDTPTGYEVEVYRVSDDTLMHSLSLVVGLETGQNGVSRTAEGTALSYETEYSWRARYTDSKGAVGAWSPLRVFKPSESPTIAITAPGATVSSPAFPISWTLTSPGGKSQGSYRVVVQRQSDGVEVFNSGSVVSATTSLDLPAGLLQNGVTYDIFVYADDSDGLAGVDSVSPTQPYAMASTLADWVAPLPPADFSAAPDPATSTVRLTWAISALTADEFAYYAIYRRVVGEATWTPYAVVTTQSTVEYVDYYAANGVLYDYKVTQFKHVPGDSDLESEEESVASSILDVDEWFVIGSDGSADHSFELPVYQEGHQKPVQQEVFEPLGSRRKKSARGNALGNEGTLDMTFTKDEREVARGRMEWLGESAGPHILKTPFGDVWSVEFSGPVFKYTGAGHMSVTIAWIEVA